MHKTTAINAGLIAAAFLLTGALAGAQTTPAAKNVHPREAGSGQASGNVQRKDGATTHADFPRSMNARNSAHASGSASPSNNATTNNNPLYKESGGSGTNPLYEHGSRTDSKTAGSGKTDGSGTQKETKFKQDFGQVQASKR